jgi:hypothetical protein
MGNEGMKEVVGLCDESMCDPMVHGIKLDDVVFLAEVKLNVWAAVIPALGRLGVVLCLIIEGHVLGLGGLPNVRTGAKAIGNVTGNEEVKEVVRLCDDSTYDLTVHGIKLDVNRGMQRD